MPDAARLILLDFRGNAIDLATAVERGITSNYSIQRLPSRDNWIRFLAAVEALRLVVVRFRK